MEQYGVSILAQKASLGLYYGWLSHKKVHGARWAVTVLPSSFCPTLLCYWARWVIGKSGITLNVSRSEKKSQV
jgi:hypothetical protein